MAKSITGKPTRKAYSVTTPARDGDGSTCFRVKYNFGEWIYSDNNPNRAEGYDCWWTVTMYEVATGKTKDLIFKERNNYNRMTESYIILTDFRNFKAQDNKTRRLAQFYPNGDCTTGSYGWAIKNIKAQVRAWNRKGTGPWNSASRSISPSRKPDMSDMEQDETTGVVSCTITPDEGEDHADIDYTLYQLAVDDSRESAVTYPYGSYTRKLTAETEITYDVPDRMGLTYEDSVALTLTAFSRGFGGQSGTTTRSIVVAWPNKPTIQRVTVSRTGVDGTIGTQDKVTVLLKTNATKKHPTTNMALEMLANTDYTAALDIPGDARWEATGVADNGECTALSSTVAELQPDRGKTSWVRVKVWNQHEDIFYRYSEPIRITELERPAASATSGIAIAEAIAGDDGASARLLIVWDGADEATGTEVSWSADQNAWRSTNGPTTHTFTWDDGATTVDGTTWAHSALLYVAGLTGDTKYYMRARRYLDGEETTYGDYCTDATVTPAVAPGSVTLSAPAYVAEGSDLSVTWTYDGGGTQTSWQLVSGTVVTGTETVDDVTRTYQRISAATARVAASGQDAHGTHTITWERLQALAGSGTTVNLAVSVSTGGVSVESDAVTVTITQAPTLGTLSVASTLTAQPLALSVTDGGGDPYIGPLSVTCRSLGASRPTPAGTEVQAEGDVAWSLAESEGGHGVLASFTGTASLEGDFWDYGTYELTVQAIDAETGLTSDELSASFVVDYAHKAPEPGDGVTIETHDERTDEDVRRLYAEVLLAAPTGAASTDTMELWRDTPNGCYLVASEVEPGTTVTDEWAPYGGDADLAYVVACRTADGSVAWMRYEYELPCDELRIDFDGRYVELPYDLDLSDTYGKDFEGRRHMDGTTDGYWGAGVEHKGSMSTNAVPMDDPTAARALHALALHAGPAYVRTPDGCAYEADVQVTPLRRDGSGIVAVSLDATEVGLTAEYMASVPTETLTTNEEE